MNYEYFEIKDDKVDMLAYGTKTNSSFVYKNFPQDYIDTSPHLTSRNMELQSNEMYNILITRWDRIFELSGINKEELIEEFKERN